MFLADTHIKKGLKDGSIIIKPYSPKQIQPASYDIKLGNEFIFTETHLTDKIDPVKKIFPKTRKIKIKDNEEFILHPGVSILGTSYEFFGSENCLIQLSGKSSLARIGLVVHNTAGLINPGHFLNITFELCNLNSVPIVLRPKMAIAQLLFSPLLGRVETDYKKIGRYGTGKLNMVGYKSPKKR